MIHYFHIQKVFKALDRRCVDKAIEEILNLSVKKDEITIPFFRKIDTTWDHSTGKACLVFELSDEILPYVYMEKGNYITLRLKYIYKLKKSSMCLYINLSSHYNSRNPIYKLSLCDIEKFLGMDKKMDLNPKRVNFKLNTVLEDINEYTDMSITYKKIRKIDIEKKIVFTMKKNK